jgi:hypothetical protein
MLAKLAPKKFPPHLRKYFGWNALVGRRKSSIQKLL